MTQTMCGVALLLTISTASVVAGWPMQNDSVETGRLNSRIGPANRQRYESIRDAKKWRNAILVIRADGIQVISTLSSGERMVAPTDLRRTLIDLPVTAWPYGRAVAVPEIGLHPADLSDGPAIANNLNVTLAILKALDVSVDRWPSA